MGCCHGGQGPRACLATALLLLALTVAAVAALPAAISTAPRDKAALLAFKAAVTEDQGLLVNWNASTDPCADDWFGVSCRCEALPEPLAAGSCVQLNQDRANQRVLLIDFAIESLTQGRYLSGALAPETAHLTELRHLNLANNNFSGTVPDLSALALLQDFQLTQNNFSGVLPDFAGQLPFVQQVWLDQNNFTGPLPTAWCNGNATSRLHVAYNPYLCGAVPVCLQGRLNSTDLLYTGFVRPLDPNDPASPGGVCNPAPPTCSAALGCRVSIEPFTTNATFITFNFTNFTSTAGDLTYRWALGTAPNLDNVVKRRLFHGSNESVAVTVGNETIPQTAYFVDYTFTGTQLINGENYTVTVTAETVAGQYTGEFASTNATSDATVVDTTGPYLPPDSQVYNTLNSNSVQTTMVVNEMGISWDAFVSNYTPIVDYQYAVWGYYNPPGPTGGSVTAPASPNFTAASSASSGLATGLQLQVGQQYIGRVCANNAARLSRCYDSPPVMVNPMASTISTSEVAIIVAASIGVGSLIVACITVYIVRTRFKARHRARKEMRNQMKQLKTLMFGLVNSSGDPIAKQTDAIRNSRELCFVITDLESSTAQASANPDAFLQIQDIHDTAMREGIAKHGGYEINTEGDAFQIAFTSVSAAVLFCLETQYQLLESEWPRDVLRLPSCKEVYAADGSLLFRGPRVRMGIHWAAEGTVAHRLHLLTKHRVFSGPGFQVAGEVGDAAYGGQVLMTHDAWLHLRNRMDRAGFPTVEQLGLFKLDSWPAPMWIYQVSHLLGKPLLRVFGAPRHIQLLDSGWGLNIVPPPDAQGPRGRLTFVALRLAAEDIAGAGPGATLELLPVVAHKLYEVVAVVAMQFQGYIFKVHDTQGRFMLAFSSTLDAVRFCHAAQVTVLYTQWPPETAEVAGAVEYTPDGRLINRGPRIAMAIHSSDQWGARGLSEESLKEKRQAEVDYEGHGEELTRHICNVARGGQVVLTEQAWSAVQDHIPGQAQVISLGVHVIDHEFLEAVLLMEVMPVMLARRTFPHPRTLEQLEPGYRDSPDPHHDMAIVFVKVAKPGEVQAAEQAVAPLSDEAMIRVISEYHVAVQLYSQVARDLLPLYDGYECKEPEPGKFTLAFRQLEQAVRWCAAVQHELLAVDWPASILECEDCREQCDVNGTVIWRGLRVRMGMAWGKPAYRKPLNTGRADYYGNLPNLAARVSALAGPGQILVEGSRGFARGDSASGWLREDSLLAPPLPRELSQTEAGEDAMELKQLGYYLLKGLDDPKLILQAVPASLAARHFQLPASAIRVSQLHKSMKNSFNSSDTSGTARGLIEMVGLQGRKVLVDPLLALTRSNSSMKRHREGDATPHRIASRTHSTIVASDPAAEPLDQLRVCREERQVRSLSSDPPQSHHPFLARMSSAPPLDIIHSGRRLRTHSQVRSGSLSGARELTFRRMASRHPHPGPNPFEHPSTQPRPGPPNPFAVAAGSMEHPQHSSGSALDLQSRFGLASSSQSLPPFFRTPSDSARRSGGGRDGGMRHPLHHQRSSPQEAAPLPHSAHHIHSTGDLPDVGASIERNASNVSPMSEAHWHRQYSSEHSSPGVATMPSNPFRHPYADFQAGSMSGASSLELGTASPASTIARQFATISGMSSTMSAMSGVSGMSSQSSQDLRPAAYPLPMPSRLGHMTPQASVEPSRSRRGSYGDLSERRSSYGDQDQPRQSSLERGDSVEPSSANYAREVAQMFVQGRRRSSIEIARPSGGFMRLAHSNYGSHSSTADIEPAGSAEVPSHAIDIPSFSEAGYDYIPTPVRGGAGVSPPESPTRTSSATSTRSRRPRVTWEDGGASSGEVEVEPRHSSGSRLGHAGRTSSLPATAEEEGSTELTSTSMARHAGPPPSGGR